MRIVELNSSILELEFLIRVLDFFLDRLCYSTWIGVRQIYMLFFIISDILGLVYLALLIVKL